MTTTTHPPIGPSEIDAVIATLIAEANLPLAQRAYQPGDTITLGGGEYSNVSFDDIPDLGSDPVTGLPYAPITFKGADGEQVVLLGDTTIKNSNDLAFENIVFQATFQTKYHEVNSNAAVQIANSSDISFDGCLWRGYEITAAEIFDVFASDDSASNLEDLEKLTGLSAGTGMNISVGSTNVTVANSEFTELGYAVKMSGGAEGQHIEGTTFENNYFHGIRKDGINGKDHNNTTIKNNYFTDFDPYRVDPDNPNGFSDEHGDMIQFWGNNADYGVRNLTVENNIFFDPDEHVQGVRIALESNRNNVGTDVQMTGITIDNNHIHLGTKMRSTFPGWRTVP